MLEARDPLGNAIRVQREASVAAVGGFVEGFLRYTPRIVEVLAAAEHDDSLIVQTLAAVLWLFSEAPVGPPKARAFLDRARRAGLPATEREQQLAQAVALWAAGDLPAALACHEAMAAEHPRDLAAVKLGQVHAFNLGDAPAMLRLSLRSLPATSDLAEAHGMAAFAWEQCHRLDAAEAAARHALALRPAEPWAEHALAHVMLTEGRFREGLAFMLAASAPWNGLTSFMRTHNWWHLALFHLELGEDAEALRLYDSQVWGVDKTYSQDQVGAVSLLARLELAGVDVGARWQELAGWLAPRVDDQVLPFLDMQYLYGLARAGRPEVDTMLRHIEVRANGSEGSMHNAWREVAWPACRGLAAHARGQWADAVEPLGRALPGLLAIGGSHAQRDLFEQIFIDALQRSGRLSAAQNLLQPRLNAQPASLRLRRRLGAINEMLGFG